tara:strand:+ start:714 stop:1637 length:924 start_codon:yes stop_codon:yes gene_type:complete
MFSKKPKKSGAQGSNLDGLFREAVERNTSVGIVRLGRSGEDPLAQGRMLRFRDDVLVIEELQIIGRHVVFKEGDRIEAYFKVNGKMLTFESKVLSLEMPTYLNKVQRVQSMHLSGPAQLRMGDRRSAYRASVSVSKNEIPVKMWFLDRFQEDVKTDSGLIPEDHKIYYTNLMSAKRFDAEIPVDEEGVELAQFDWQPILQSAFQESPHALGRVVDLTANGLGILMYGVSNMQLNRFERIGVSFEIEGEEIQLVVEIRQGNDLRGSTCRVGTLLLYPDRRCTTSSARRTMERFAMMLQREQLKGRMAS